MALRPRGAERSPVVVCPNTELVSEKTTPNVFKQLKNTISLNKIELVSSLPLDHPVTPWFQSAAGVSH